MRRTHAHLDLHCAAMVSLTLNTWFLLIHFQICHHLLLLNHFHVLIILILFAFSSFCIIFINLLILFPFVDIHPLRIIHRITLPDQKRRKEAHALIFVQALQFRRGCAPPQPPRCCLQNTFAQASVPLSQCFFIKFLFAHHMLVIFIYLHKSSAVFIGIQDV